MQRFTNRITSALAAFKSVPDDPPHSDGNCTTPSKDSNGNDNVVAESRLSLTDHEPSESRPLICDESYPSLLGLAPLDYGLIGKARDDFRKQQDDARPLILNMQGKATGRSSLQAVLAIADSCIAQVTVVGNCTD